MPRVQYFLVPAFSLATLAAFQVSAPVQKPVPQTQPIVHPGMGKSVPAVQPLRRELQLQAGAKFLSWSEKQAALKAMNLPPGGSAPPATTINLTVANHVQTVNGVYASMTYTLPTFVWPDLFGTGLATFGNSTTPWGVSNQISLPTLGIGFRPLPNKRYLFDAGLEGNTGTYTIHVQVDNATAFQQTITNAGRLLIVFPGTTKPNECFIVIRGNIPGRGYWTWYGCQITEI